MVLDLKPEGVAAAVAEHPKDKKGEEPVQAVLRAVRDRLRPLRSRLVLVHLPREVHRRGVPRDRRGTDRAGSVLAKGKEVPDAVVLGPRMAAAPGGTSGLNSPHGRPCLPVPRSRPRRRRRCRRTRWRAVSRSAASASSSNSGRHASTNRSKGKPLLRPTPARSSRHKLRRRPRPRRLPLRRLLPPRQRNRPVTSPQAEPRLGRSLRGRPFFCPVRRVVTAYELIETSQITPAPFGGRRFRWPKPIRFPGGVCPLSQRMQAHTSPLGG